MMVLRLAMLALLALTLWRGVDEGEVAGVVHLTESLSANGESPLHDVLAGRTTPQAVVRTTRHQPGDAELLMLGALADRTPVVGILPEPALQLSARAPGRPLAGRAAAVHFTVRGAAGDSVPVRLVDEAGVVDSVIVALDAGGVARGGFRVRPERAGWHGWTVSTGDLEAPAGAWVRDAGPLSVLIVAGPPDWESRFVARALEEAGATVTAAQPLGRGLSSGAAPSTLPASSGELSRYDAVVVLHSARASAQQLQALVEFVGNDGGGVVSAGHAPAIMALGMATPMQTLTSVGAGALRWSTPPEIVPLPGGGVELAVQPLVPASATAVAVASAPPGDVLVLATRGRGRTAALGITDTWRWRMEAGRVEEHRAFWRSLTDWLAGGVRDTVTLHLARVETVVGAPVTVAVRGAAGQTQPQRQGRRGGFARAPAAAALRDASEDPHLLLMRPDGNGEVLPLANAHGQRAARFLPAQPGTHTLRWVAAPSLSAARPAGAEAGPATASHAWSRSAAMPAADTWARFALVAQRSGGGLVDSEDLDAAVEALGVSERDRLTAAWLFALVVTLALAEWLIRRTVAR